MSQLNSPFTIDVINDILSKAVLLLDSNETPSSVLTNSTVETDLMSYNLASNNYAKIIMECEVKCSHLSEMDDFLFTFKFMQDSTVESTFSFIITGSSSGPNIGGESITHLKATIVGGKESPVVLKLTGKIGAAAPDISLQALSFRIYATY
jgi:hypothetical protein